MNKMGLGLFSYKIGMLGEKRNGNFNCRWPGIIIVVDQNKMPHIAHRDDLRAKLR